MSAGIAAGFRSWLTELVENCPRPIVTDKPVDVTDILFTDASVDRWGAIHVEASTGIIRVYSREWTASDRERWNLASSVASEPLAIANTLCCCVSPRSDKHIRIYTDHQPVVDALSSDCAKGYSYWRLQSLVRTLPCRISVRYIPGEDNPSDSFSRGDVSEDDLRWRIILAESWRKHHLPAEPKKEVDGLAGPEWASTASNPLRVLNSFG